MLCKRQKKEEKDEVELSADVTDTNFLVMNRCPPFAKPKLSSKKINVRANLNQMTFMRQIDVTPKQRDEARMERIRVATNYRR